MEILGVGENFAKALNTILGFFEYKFEASQTLLKVFFGKVEKKLFSYNDGIKPSLTALGLPQDPRHRPKFQWLGTDIFRWSDEKHLSNRFSVGELHRDKQRERYTLISAVNVNVVSQELLRPRTSGEATLFAGAREPPTFEEPHEKTEAHKKRLGNAVSPPGVKRFSSELGFFIAPEEMKQRKIDAIKEVKEAILKGLSDPQCYFLVFAPFLKKAASKEGASIKLWGYREPLESMGLFTPIKDRSNYYAGFAFSSTDPRKK